ncbi:fatty acid oxidation complex subunit alpha FadB [Reinekea forsetii]|uniref:enoyl-CoA hydratase n=2 Tax=Reinekea forsetii TaxID=1336806 RepID=A0A2K8KPK2_9GAMM|nr:fatty acid oxidation complex subunit alpha FadB [Reinekea forsetii]ATX76700.1 enoyl-CoA hydratase / delta-cis-delta(2)-trans-enoyl-CoA isomerase / 3-hydroxyacyl-CoA dehydrogenase [Reinekea forsetii]
MIYQGKNITVTSLAGDLAELVFDLAGESVNKFDQLTLAELGAATEHMRAAKLKGLLVTSAKQSFIVGADINEFQQWFEQDEAGIIVDVLKANAIFSAFEDLPFPTVVAINGICLGGGMEMALACDYRLMSTQAKVGLPEVKLGLFPGFGGTVRLSRLIGADNAIEWIASGAEKNAAAALSDGAVDAVIEHEQVKAEALVLLHRVASGELDYLQRRQAKQGKLQLNPIESMMVFETAKGFVAAKAGKHYPAPVEAIKTMQKHAGFERDKALAIEAKGFAKMAKTAVAKNLIGLFLNDQKIKKIAKQHAKAARDVKQAAVLGAGIMGGGIAYQSAYKGTSILMKDINEAGLQLGLDEATNILLAAVERKRLDVRGVAQTLTRIRPTLSYGDFNQVDVCVEAVVENVRVKKTVLAEAETHLRPGAVLASNTSTISITELASVLTRPEDFCGMHFFNPVNRMPLVEVIRGEKTSEETIATVVAYAQKMGKTPIVVNDCPGFLVNRILFPYFGGFAGLLRDGADFERVDKLMERFGWPMGPAYLMDVVGIDTGVHAQAVMAEGFPDRMQQDYRTAMDVMFDAERYGQKNGSGFYQYALDKKGKLKKTSDPSAHELVATVRLDQRELSDDDIIHRLMLPMCLETIRCLEDGIVASAAEADLGLIYGVGFPPFRGGALKYVDDLGAAAFVALCDRYQELGKLYEPTQKLRDMAANNQTFYTQ